MFWIENISDRAVAVYQSLDSALPTRIVKRSLMHFDQHDDGEIETGVVMLVSEGESDYSQNLGMTALEPTHHFLLVCHLKVSESTPPIAVELAEMAMIEELKTWIKTGIPGMALDIEGNTQQSRQLEHPYGWAVMRLTAKPPKHNLY